MSALTAQEKAEQRHYVELHGRTVGIQFAEDARIERVAEGLTSAHKILAAMQRREELRQEFRRTGSDEVNGRHYELSEALRRVGALAA